LLFVSHCQITATATVGMTQGSSTQIRADLAHRPARVSSSAVAKARTVCTTRFPTSHTPDRPRDFQNAASESTLRYVSSPTNCEGVPATAWLRRLRRTVFSSGKAITTSISTSRGVTSRMPKIRSFLLPLLFPLLVPLLGRAS
jgi:hypothetical protein